LHARFKPRNFAVTLITGNIQQYIHQVGTKGTFILYTHNSLGWWYSRNVRVSLILNVMFMRFKAIHMFYELQTRKAFASNFNAIFRESIIDVFVSNMTRERELVLKLTNRFVRVRWASDLSVRHGVRNACCDVNIGTRCHVSGNSH